MSNNTSRLDYLDCRALLEQRLSRPSPAPIQVVAGPRQVGKTTLLLDLARRRPDTAVYGAADAPEAALPGFWERLWQRAEQQAAHDPAVLLVDEIHLLLDWSARLAEGWDRVRQLQLPLQVVVTGSSALLVGDRSSETLGGRFESLVLPHWPTASLASEFGLSLADAAELNVQYGSYPGAQGYRYDFDRWRAHVRDTVIEPALGRDIPATQSVRRLSLLRQVFAVAVSVPSEVVSLQKLQSTLPERSSLETIRHYLGQLEQAYLVAALPKFTAGAHRRRAAPPKLITLSNALLTAMHPDGPPDPVHESARFGAWVTNACLAHAVNQGQQVSYWREEPLEVAAIIEGSWGAWAVEVKTGELDQRRLRALGEFTQRHPRFRPLVITSPGAEPAAERWGFAARSWPEFLGTGP